MKVKIVTILGARPQFVKAAVLSNIIQVKNEIEEVIVHTGQHFDENLSAVFFEEMQIPTPKYFLNINGSSHGKMTGEMLAAVEEILIIEKPALVVVYGDTNSTLAGALAAKKLHIKVVHIEAGLRSFNMQMPEEINRILTDRISDLLLCPTQEAVKNLENEGFLNFDAKIHIVGDIMKDAVSGYLPLSNQRATILEKLQLQRTPFVLATIHRQENTDNITRLEQILEGLQKVHQHIKVVVPIHPRTQKIIEKSQWSYPFMLIPPVGYFDMLQLLQHCAMVFTDSGGLQKEAYYVEKPVVVLRDETEWGELVHHGIACLAGANAEVIYQSYIKFSQTTVNFPLAIYGEQVGEKCYEELVKMLPL